VCSIIHKLPVNVVASGLNYELFCCSAWRRHKICSLAPPQTIDISCLPGTQQQTYSMLLQQANGTNRGQTDGWTPTVTQTLPHTIRALSKIQLTDLYKSESAIGKPLTAPCLEHRPEMGSSK